MSEKLEWAALWAAMDETPYEWIETTEAMYWEMLECVPPRAQDIGRFLVGEAVRDNKEGVAIYACFRQTGDRFFAKHMTFDEFRGVAA